MATKSNSENDTNMLGEFARLNNELITLQRELVQKNVALESQIKENQELQDRLIKVEKEKVLMQTAGAVAHEINQPLTVIFGLSHLLLEERKEDAYLVEMVNDLFEAAQKISRIVNKMSRARQVVTKHYLGDVHIMDFDGQQNPPSEQTK